jgi:hypothetical protein
LVCFMGAELIAGNLLFGGEHGGAVEEIGEGRKGRAVILA